MTAAAFVLVEMLCRYCGRECDARKGERLVADLAGRTLSYRHVVCPRETEEARARSAAGGAS